MQAQERWGLAGQGPNPTQDNLAGAEGRTLLLALAVRVVLVDSGETRWLSLAEAQTEELSAGMAWAVGGGPWPGKLEQGAVQAEAGDAGPPARPVLPGALRRAAAPDLQPALPTLSCSLPWAQQQRGKGDLRSLESVGAQCTFAGSWTQGPSVSSCLVSAAPGQNPCFCPRVASCDTPAGPACPSHWWGTEARGGQTLTQSCTVSQGTLGTESDVVS